MERFCFRILFSELNHFYGMGTNSLMGLSFMTRLLKHENYSVTLLCVGDVYLIQKLSQYLGDQFLWHRKITDFGICVRIISSFVLIMETTTLFVSQMYNSLWLFCVLQHTCCFATHKFYAVYKPGLLLIFHIKQLLKYSLYAYIFRFSELIHFWNAGFLVFFILNILLKYTF